MNFKSDLIKNTVIMTATNLLMRSVAVSFNAYLTSKIGSAGIGLFQLIMTVYSLAVTFSCAGIKLASTRLTVEINTNRKNDLNRSMKILDLYAFICGCTVCILFFLFSDIIAKYWISDDRSASSVRILALSVPFVAFSSSLSGYITSSNLVGKYSAIQLIEQGTKFAVAVIILNSIRNMTAKSGCIAIVTAISVSEAVSFTLSFILKKMSIPKKSEKPRIRLMKLFRIALPDAAGTCARSILLTIEHLLIPKGFEKSGTDSASALSAYGNIHAMALPILLYPSAVLTSFSTMLIPELAEKYEKKDRKSNSLTVEKIYSVNY